MVVYTIGFTRKSAERFFGLVASSGARSLTDVRRHPETQLSGFAKGRDLAYFLPRLAGVGYAHEPLLAPSEGLLARYRTEKLPWDAYERAFLRELAERRVESVLDRATLDGTVLLCSEESPAHCHRRLCVEYLAAHWGAIEQIDL